MFKIIWGILDGIIIGLCFNLFVFSFLLDMSDNAPEWLMMIEVLIVLAFACLGFVISTIWLDKDKEN